VNQSSEKPSMFGLQRSNKDFTKPENWGKNTFNNAFPASLMCYLHKNELQPIYLRLDDLGKVTHQHIDVEGVIGMSPTSASTFFVFESDFPAYRALVFDTLPRTDLVMMNTETGQFSRALEIKLTAIPDNATYPLDESQYGCELVVRPDTILYIALRIISSIPHLQLQNLFASPPFGTLKNWGNLNEVAPHIPEMMATLNELLIHHHHLQTPLVLQPIWKTQGKKLLLHENAFDFFVWSDFAFTRLFFREVSGSGNTVSRGARAVVWLAKMLQDYINNGRISYRQVIDQITFNSKNDKAFAVNGKITHSIMSCPELARPRFSKTILNEIILGGAEQYLSPERRLDAAILSTMGIFD